MIIDILDYEYHQYIWQWHISASQDRDTLIEKIKFQFRMYQKFQRMILMFFGHSPFDSDILINDATNEQWCNIRWRKHRKISQKTDYTAMLLIYSILLPPQYYTLHTNSWRTVTSQNNQIWKWIVSFYPYMENS